MKMKILFLIPNLSHGGAEKVLVNLANNIDKSKFDVTVQTLFDVGVNRQFLHDDVKYIGGFKKMPRGNSHILKLFSPRTLYKHFIKEHYDVVISYLEGPTARIVSGCPDEGTKLVSWIHIQQETRENASRAFRNYSEAKRCYDRFDNTVCVSEYIKQDFTRIFDFKNNIEVLYNTNETDEILHKSEEPLDVELDKNAVNICVVGKLLKSKGCDKVCNIQKRLTAENINTHTYFLGEGPLEDYIKEFARKNDLEDKITLLGYQTNPYKYVKKCDLFVCASMAEGFSTAATESLIVGTPVVTVDVSGMTEMLGEHGEYGVVTENSEDALYEGIKTMLTTPGMLSDYAARSKERGKAFSTDKTVRAVEEMITSLLDG